MHTCIEGDDCMGFYSGATASFFLAPNGFLKFASFHLSTADIATGNRSHITSLEPHGGSICGVIC